MNPFAIEAKPVTVEYDRGNERARKTFDDAYLARRFFVAKDKAKRRPRVVGDHPASKRRAPASKIVACYVRVSSVGQNEAGQRAEIERWLSGNGIEARSIRWFVDKGKSGDTLKRPEFSRLQSAVFNGEIGTIVVYKLDRLSRKLREGLDVLCDWCERGLRVVSVTQQIDFNGTMGKMLAAVLLGIAEMEQETRRERQRAGIEEARKAGKYRGRKPGTTKAKPARALKLREKGLTVEEIGEALGVSRNTVFVYLRQAKS
jgi:DNA invertase Pin-like site-specific DNA recombinase